MKIKMKNSWSEVTLEERIQIEDIFSSEVLEPEDKILHAIAILTGEDVELVNSLPFQDFCSLSSNLDFLKVTPKQKCPDKVTINNHKYLVVNDLSKVTTAQYFDLISDLKKYSQDRDTQTLYGIIALFLIPEGHKYLDGYDLDEVVADVPNIKYAEVEGLISFFMMCRERFMKLTLNYLLSQVPKKERKEIKRKLRKSMTPTTLLETYHQLQK